MRSKGLVIAIAVLAVLVIGGSLAYSALSDKTEPGVSLSESTVPEGADVTVQNFALEDADGGSTTFHIARGGKLSIVNFWTTWCQYCVAEMDDYQKLYEEYGDRVQFVMIDCTDGVRETVEDGAAYIAEHGYTFPVYFDVDQDAVKSFGIQSYPTTALVGPDDKLVSLATGRIDPDTVRKTLDQLLAQ